MLTNPAFYSEQKAADAHAYKMKVEAEARFHAASKDAEANLIRQQREAAGLSAMAGAYSAFVDIIFVLWWHRTCYDMILTGRCR